MIANLLRSVTNLSIDTHRSALSSMESARDLLVRAESRTTIHQVIQHLDAARRKLEAGAPNE